MKNRRKAVLFCALFCISLTYFKGLDAPFMLDDWSNLDPLSSMSGHPLYISSIIEFLANNTSGQLGRPVSLLSFALQADAWPNNPAAFKTVNLILHLSNGLLIFSICSRLTNSLTLSATSKFWLPPAVCGLWLIQPMHVSSVLYAVQRMALLASFFSLLAILGYLQGREIALKQPAKGYWITGLSLLLGGTLAVFSKENGILILLYVAVLEYTLFYGQPAPKYWRQLLLIFVATPIALAAAYVLMHLPEYAAAHAGRNYTLPQHLLTESRIMLEYLNKILLPRPDAFGLFFDDYVVSTSLTTPVSTLISLIMVGGVLLSAVFLRNKQPIFSFAVLWFFAGHVLESTVIPLELYFEHRNYLPSLGIVFGLCYYFVFFLQKASSRSVKYSFLGLAAVYGLGVWFICYQEARLWANPAQQALSWQKSHPTSKRANELAYQAWIKLNIPLKADSYLQNIAAIDPKDSASYLIRLETHCYVNHIPSAERLLFIKRLKNTRSDNATAMSANSLVQVWIAGECQYLEASYIEQVLETVLKNTPDGHLLSHITSSLSLLYAAEGKYPQAFETLNQAIKRMPQAYELRLLKIRWAIANKQFDDALAWIEEARTQTPPTFLNKLNFFNQLDIMESDIKKMR